MLPMNLCELRVTFGEKLDQHPDRNHPDPERDTWTPHTPPGDGWCLIDFRATSDQHGELSCVYLWARPRGAK
jgi:hypothetical protein